MHSRKLGLRSAVKSTLAMHCGIHSLCVFGLATWHAIPLQSQPPLSGHCSADQRERGACQAWPDSRITGARRCHRPLRLGFSHRCFGSLTCCEAPAERHAGAAQEQPAATRAAGWYAPLHAGMLTECCLRYLPAAMSPGALAPAYQISQQPVQLLRPCKQCWWRRGLLHCQAHCAAKQDPITGGASGSLR